MKLRKLDTSTPLPQAEHTVLHRWQADDTFNQSIRQREGSPEWVFYDGPPFATGLPHPGTLLSSILKDVFPRYQTMRGKQVPRGWGWDCHGLPLETQAEKNLGVTDKRDIDQRVGVAAFNAECRRIVDEYNGNWKEYVDRVGRWVNFDNPYRTMDTNFMESVWWVFAELYKKGLIYKDYRVTPYSWAEQTPLSISETRLDDSTRPRQDPTVTVKFTLKEPLALAGGLPTHLLAWTTTPWTLPMHQALAAGRALTYGVYGNGTEAVVLATARAAAYEKELAGYEKLGEISGEQLIGLRYQAPFSYLEESKYEAGDVYRVLAADFVTDEDGTGIAHQAPAFGEDDYWLCKREGIKAWNPTDDAGCYTAGVPTWQGRLVLDCNTDVTRAMRALGRVFAEGSVLHNYPHSWRSGQPLIYRAVDAWYVDIEQLKPAMLAANEEIQWHPQGLQHGRFGKWLEGARDWNISRNRYWGTPLPVWECAETGERVVVSSIAELAQYSGITVTDLHKEFVDGITWTGAQGGTMRRVPEVLDCWFESGAMPYGQVHYPFENKDWFDAHFPADYIVEYTGQIRGWFYTLHVLAVALFGRPAFRHVMVHGTLLAEDGQKISKSKKNYTDPLLLVDRYGADAVRAYLLGSPAVGIDDLRFADSGVEETARRLLLPYWNALSFYTTYGEIDGVDTAEVEQWHRDMPWEQLGLLDQYIIGETLRVQQRVEQAMDSYDLANVMAELGDHLDRLNNLYIRRHRSVVWQSGLPQEKKVFYATLQWVLRRWALITAPFMPFMADYAWELLGGTGSVHLQDWPKQESAPGHDALRQRVEVAREVVSAGLAARAIAKIKVRQPLARAIVAVPATVDIRSFEEMIRDELNVKRIEYDSGIATAGIKLDEKALGPTLKQDMQKVITAARNGEYEIHGDAVRIAGHTIPAGLWAVKYTGHTDMPVASSAYGAVAIDPLITEELRLEGIARDIMRAVQELRKDSDLQIAQRISLHIAGAPAVITAHGSTIAAETLAAHLDETTAGEHRTQLVLDDGSTVHIGLSQLDSAV